MEDTKYTHEDVSWYGSKALKDLSEQLSNRKRMGIPDPPMKSIMMYGVICDHTSGYLCEHRLQHILNYIRENFKEI